MGPGGRACMCVCPANERTPLSSTASCRRAERRSACTYTRFLLDFGEHRPTGGGAFSKLLDDPVRPGAEAKAR
jgi:hypothetical protein